METLLVLEIGIEDCTEHCGPNNEINKLIKNNKINMDGSIGQLLLSF